MGTSDHEDEPSRKRRLEAQRRILLGLLDYLPDAEDTIEDIERSAVNVGRDWATFGVRMMAWNRSIPIPQGDSILLRDASPGALTTVDDPRLNIDIPGVLSVSLYKGRIIVQFPREPGWPSIARVLFVVRVGAETWVHETPILLSNELSVYLNLGTEAELRVRLQNARTAIVASPDATLNFEFILSSDDESSADE